MDPTANLMEQIDIAFRILESDDIGDGNRLAELVFALHEWISRGGALPDQWKRR